MAGLAISLHFVDAWCLFQFDDLLGGVCRRRDESGDKYNDDFVHGALLTQPA
jgi:hypothetical protein